MSKKCLECGEITPGLVYKEVVKEGSGVIFSGEFIICSNKFHLNLINKLNKLYNKESQ